MAIEPGLEDSTVNQHWVQMVMGNERVMLITFEMVLNSVTGTMNIYIPFTMLKPIANVLNPHAWFSGRKERQSDPDARQTAEASLSQVNLDVRVLLGTARLTFDELVKLKPGDVISLDTSVNQDLSMYVANRTCFKVRVGKVGKRMAAQVISVASPMSEQ